MPKKTWFPSSTEGGGAKGLAKKYGIKLADIEPHRSDLKVTIEDVKRAKNLKDRGKPSSSKASTSSLPVAIPTIKVLKISLLVEPKVLDDERIETLTLSSSNLNILKRWWERHLPGVKYVVPISNENVQVVKSPKSDNKYLLKITFNITEPSRDDVEIAVKGVVDLDDDGNYPVWILDGKILTIEKIKRDSTERDDLEDSGAVQALVTGTVLDVKEELIQKFNSLRGSSKFGG